MMFVVEHLGCFAAVGVATPRPMPNSSNDTTERHRDETPSYEPEGRRCDVVTTCGREGTEWVHHLQRGWCWACPACARTVNALDPWNFPEVAH